MSLSIPSQRTLVGLLTPFSLSSRGHRRLEPALGRNTQARRLSLCKMRALVIKHTPVPLMTLLIEGGSRSQPR
jgi:hypothetical protein